MQAAAGKMGAPAQSIERRVSGFWNSIMTNRPSIAQAVICVPNHVTTMTSYGRMTSSVTWPFDSA